MVARGAEVRKVTKLKKIICVAYRRHFQSRSPFGYQQTQRFAVARVDEFSVVSSSSRDKSQSFPYPNLGFSPLELKHIQSVSDQPGQVASQRSPGLKQPRNRGMSQKNVDDSHDNPDQNSCRVLSVVLSDIIRHSVNVNFRDRCFEMLRTDSSFGAQITLTNNLLSIMCRNHSARERSTETTKDRTTRNTRNEA